MNNTALSIIEKKFLSFSNLNLENSLVHFPIAAGLKDQVSKNKIKSKNHGEVFTPLWLVDDMIKKSEINLKNNKSTLDLCSGYGQFSVRLLRFFCNKSKNFNIEKYLKNNHYFSEIQLSSCFKLLSIFGTNINLFIGDALKLNLIPKDAKGIWVYIKSFNNWINLTNIIKNTFNNGFYSEEIFVSDISILIDNLNKEYEKVSEHKKMIEKFKDFTKLKDWEAISTYMIGELNKAECRTNTPDSIIEDMISKINLEEIKSILVLFNIEIVHTLIAKGISADKITFASYNDDGYISEEYKRAWCLVEGNAKKRLSIVKNAFKVNVISFDSDFFNDSKNKKDIKNWSIFKQYDLVLTNPPYNDNLNIKILSSLMAHNISKKYIVVQPTNSLLDSKGKKEIFNDAKYYMNKYLTDIKLFNGNPIFCIDLFYPCGIFVYDIAKQKNNEINVEFDFEENTKFTAASVSDIKLFGSNWEKIVKPFNTKMHNICNEDNMWAHNIAPKNKSEKDKQLNNNKHYAQLAALIGNHHENEKNMYKDDFYTLVPKNSEIAKGIRKSMSSRPGPTFEFDSEFERDNFIEFCKTKFARFCLSLLKISANIFYGELSLIPWLDFTQQWDDNKLFSYFEIDKETQNYINNYIKTWHK